MPKDASTFLLWVALTYGGLAVPLSAQMTCPQGLRDAGAVRQLKGNPVFHLSSLEHGAVEFDRIRSGHFRQALVRGLRMIRERLAVLRADASKPSFENSVWALETLWEPLRQTLYLFNSYSSLKATPALQAVVEKLQPRISRLRNEIYADPHLFRRIEAIHREREGLGLSVEQKTLVENMHSAFVRNGVHLPPRTRQRIADIDSHLAGLAHRFKTRLLQAGAEGGVEITDSRDLAGLPEWLVQSAAKEARERRKGG